MYTYQDFQKAKQKGTNIGAICNDIINDHKASPDYLTAVDADRYDHQMNTTINQIIQVLFSSTGLKYENFVASNNKIACNYFHRLNTQRNTYLLGNGIYFPGGKDKSKAIKDKLGEEFDTVLKKAAYYGLIHAVGFIFMNIDKAHAIPLTQFAPLWDEESGALKAGVRFWRIAADKPLVATLYEEDGYTEMQSKGSTGTLEATGEKLPYKQIISKTAADGEVVIGGTNYSALPIVPIWGNSLHQSTLVGMKQSIDSYDIIRSGFANDLTDLAQVYYIVKNASGMKDEDLDEWRRKLLLTHVMQVDGDEEGASADVKSFELPYQARQAFLSTIKAGMYEDFGALDVHTIAAGATNDHIDAAYQPLDEEADEYEFCVIEAVRQLLALQGIAGTDATPIFKRNRISNTKEQVETAILEAPYLTDRKILQLFPNVSVDEIDDILDEKAKESMTRFGMGGGGDTTTEETPDNEDNPDETEETPDTGGAGLDGE